MFAHEVINHINKFIKSTVEVPESIHYRNMLTSFASTLRNAVKYHIGTYKTDILDKLTVMMDDYKSKTGKSVYAFNTFYEYIKPPYDTMWVDFYVDNEENRKMGVLLHKHGNVLKVHGAMFNCKLQWVVQPYGYNVIMDDERCDSILELDTHQSTYSKYVDGELTGFAETITHVAYITLLFLNYKNIKIVDNQPSRLMSMITNKNKCPMFVYKTLIITDNTVIQNKNKRPGTYIVKGVMKEHSVGGHPRRCKSGVIAQIPAHKRGDRKNGIIEKEYVFVNGVLRKRTKKIMAEKKEVTS